MIDNIDIDKLLPYKDDKKKSFEELCYQICKEKYAASGLFTSIDDSGGGDGVEFYLTTKDDEIWGWQCKYIDRLNEGGRKDQIKKSLKRAYQIHGSKLKKWILCSKKSLTPDEHSWFENDLPSSTCNGEQVLPNGHKVELNHWGDSEILSYLRKYTDIYNFFFNDKIVSFDWFRTKADEIFNKSSIKVKYISDVHTECQAQEDVYRIIGGKHLAKVIQNKYDLLEVDKFVNEFKIKTQNLENFEVKLEYKSIFDEIKPFVIANKEVIGRGKTLISEGIKILESESFVNATALINVYQEYLDKLHKFYEQYSTYKESQLIKQIDWDTEDGEKDHNKKLEIKVIRETILGAYFTLRNYFRPFINIFESIQQIGQQELHITGGASKGKTHLVANIFEQYIRENKPAIFLSGKDFITNLTIEEQIFSLLDIPKTWTFTQFLSILDYYGRVSDTKSLIIIDGLNESIYWKTIWGSGLENLSSKITVYKNITLITTYRQSYEDQLFPNNYFLSDINNYLKRSYVDGFDNENIDEAITKYTQHYNVTINNCSTVAYYFQQEPLCLRIFCETKKDKTVDLFQESLFDVFDQFIEKCNNNIINILCKESRYNKTYLLNHLKYVAKYLWERNVSCIPLSELMPVKLNECELLAIESEDLLVMRDWRGEETLSFTYDLLAGYIIAKDILAQFENKNEYISFLSNDLKTKLLLKDLMHPLFEDILHCLCILSIKKFGFIYDEIDTMPYCKYVINSVYEIGQTNLADYESKIKDYIFNLFNEYGQFILQKSSYVEFDINHPLNFNYTSDLLKALSISNRDLIWSEEIRKEYNNYQYRDIRELIETFENSCREKRQLKEMVHLVAKQVMWCLTSTNHELRYNATRALYFYGIKYLREFYKLFLYSSSINDIYVLERMLAITYGIVLSIQDKINEEKKYEEFLYSLSKVIYTTLFSENKTVKTTHVLVRDYAKKILKLALRYNQILFDENEQNNILSENPIFYKEDIDKWDEIESFSGPIRMDFSNYTLGYIIPGGHSYSNPPLKKKGRWYIYNKINELGWEESKFAEVDNLIDNESDSYSRHNDSSKIDRYGKKYSWIAYYELAGILADISLIKSHTSGFNIINSDIDPTFPEIAKEYQLNLDDFLGDGEPKTDKWLKTKDSIDINNCLYGNLLQEKSFICVYGYFCSENIVIGRKRFTFIRPIIVYNSEKCKIVELLNKQDIGGRWLPEVRKNSDCFAGEINCWNEATHSNWVKLSFEIGIKAEMFSQNNTENSIFQVLLPTMEYLSEDDFSCGTGKIISKEISQYAKLKYLPQSFDLIDKNGNFASKATMYNKNNYNNSQDFLFIRKDILDDYLKNNNMSMIWCIWGEKDVSEQPYQFINFQQIQEYNI